MGIHSPVFKAIQKKGYGIPTPIQRKVIPELLEGKDVVAMARTGSGKTACFVIPILHHLKIHSTQVGARALVISPTRELTTQSYVYVKTISKYTDLRTICLVGGESIQDQFSQLCTNPDILIATPGRLLQILEESGQNLLSRIQMVIFDEADRLFELGFSSQLYRLLDFIPTRRITGLFSATLPQTLVEFSKAGLKDPQFVRLDIESQLCPDLEIQFFVVRTMDKEAFLLFLLSSREFCSIEDRSPELAGGIVFVATRHHVEYFHELLSQFSIPHSYLYGGMDQTARKIAVDEFRNCKTPVLIVTDLAARGIDLPHLKWVINYDFPADGKLFVHRVGRVARAGRPGKAISLVTLDELPYMMDLGAFLDKQVGTSQEQDDIVLGTVPEDLLFDGMEKIQEAFQTCSALEALKNTAQRARLLYTKTRPRPSPEGFAKAKSFGEIKTHPFWKSQEILESARIQMLRDIHSFKSGSFKSLGTMASSKLIPKRSVGQDSSSLSHRLTGKERDFYIPYQKQGAKREDKLMVNSLYTVPRDGMFDHSGSKPRKASSTSRAGSLYKEWRKNTKTHLPQCGSSETVLPQFHVPKKDYRHFKRKKRLK